MRRLVDRVSRLEGLSPIYLGPGAWIDLDDGETRQQGRARWEKDHGPIQPGQPVIIWENAEEAPCA